MVYIGSVNGIPSVPLVTTPLCIVWNKECELGKFPGGPVVRTQCILLWPGFNPWSGN